MKNVEVASIERIRCMCGRDDRICDHCGHPFEAAHMHNALPPTATEGNVVYLCPKCGNPSLSNTSDSKDVAKARYERGLIK